MNIPDYRLLQKCGGGAFGEVWIAEDISGRRVALKTVPRSEQSERELAGLRNYARLRNAPHLIRVFHVGELPEALYYAMELADALEEGVPYRPATLANVLALRGRLCAEAAAFLARELLDGVAALHHAGLIHRDIKPENLLFVDDVIKLSDIGLLRPLSQTLSLGGTLGFIPPERLSESSGCRNPEDDLYALGKTIYCAWSGRPPEDFPSIPAALLDEPGAKKLNAVLRAACSGNARARFRTAEEFAAALESGVPKWKQVLLLAAGAFRRPLAATLAVAAASALAAALLTRRAPAPPERPSDKSMSGIPATISVSDGTNEGTVLYSFLEGENSEARRRTSQESGFTDPRFWRGVRLVNVRQEYRLVRWDPHARGELWLAPELPDECLITFELEISHLERELWISLVPRDRHRTVRFCFRGEQGALHLSARRGGASESVSAVRPRFGTNRVELLCSSRGVRMSLNGEPAFDEFSLPRAKHFCVLADCGADTLVTLQKFSIRVEQP